MRITANLVHQIQAGSTSPSTFAVRLEAFRANLQVADDTPGRDCCELRDRAKRRSPRPTSRGHSCLELKFAARIISYDSKLIQEVIADSAVRFRASGCIRGQGKLGHHERSAAPLSFCMRTPRFEERCGRFHIYSLLWTLSLVRVVFQMSKNAD